MVHFIWVGLVLRGGTFASFLFDRISALGNLYSSLLLVCCYHYLVRPLVLHKIKIKTILYFYLFLKFFPRKIIE